jgi:two-component system cell cycle response regulator DivK
VRIDSMHRIKRVLVVDDNESNRELLLRFLRREGYQVLLADDGLRAVAMARAEAPDLILMDLDLPVVDGWEATRCVKADPATSGIPVLALSAHTSESDVSRAAAAGCVGYETKPISYNRLMQRVNQLLET